MEDVAYLIDRINNRAAKLLIADNSIYAVVHS